MHNICTCFSNSNYRGSHTQYPLACVCVLQSPDCVFALEPCPVLSCRPRINLIYTSYVYQKLAILISEHQQLCRRWHCWPQWHDEQRDEVKVTVTTYSVTRTRWPSRRRNEIMKSWVSSAYRRCEIEERLMRVLRGVVYILKRIGPRTETCDNR